MRAVLIPRDSSRGPPRMAKHHYMQGLFALSMSRQTSKNSRCLDPIALVTRPQRPDLMLGGHASRVSDGGAGLGLAQKPEEALFVRRSCSPTIFLQGGSPRRSSLAFVSLTLAIQPCLTRIHLSCIPKHRYLKTPRYRSGETARVARIIAD